MGWTSRFLELMEASSAYSTIELLNIIDIGIKHDLPFINIRKVPREVLKTEGEARGFFFISPEGPCEC